MESSNLTRLNINNKEIVILGTAHVSSDSAKEVQQFIDEEKPDSICIELDQDRYKSFTNPKKWEDTDIIEVIKTNQAFLLLSNIILSAYQRRMADKFNTNVGKEMETAINCSKEYNINLVLADRNIKTTFKRIWRKHSLKEKAKILAALIMSEDADDDISAEDIEALKETDNLEKALSEISKEFPTVYEVLVVERNKYLATKIKEAPGNKVFAVLGAAHVPGVCEEINLEHDIQELDYVPKKSFAEKLKMWIIPVIVLLLILFSFSKDTNIGWTQLKSWILIHGGLSSLACLICLAHPLTILVAFIMAPITSLNPLLATGWFAGITEAFVRKPKVSDFNSIYDDVTSFKTIIKNRVLKILLIVIVTNLVNSLATFISGADIIKNIFK